MFCIGLASTFSMSISLSSAYANPVESSDKTATTNGTCSAKADDCAIASNNWDTLTSNLSQTMDSGSKVAKDAADKSSDYAKKSWDSTKDASSDAWQKTKDVANDGWDKSKELAKKGWESTKEAAGKASQKVDEYFNKTNMQDENAKQITSSSDLKKT